MAAINIKNIVTDKWFFGTAVKGKGRGKKLGFPTINLKENFPFKNGVFLCRVKLGKEMKTGLLYYGPRPVFKEKELVAEIFIFNLKDEVELGEKIFFQLLAFLRPVMVFKTKKELQEQIRKDINRSKLIGQNLVKMYNKNND